VRIALAENVAGEHRFPQIVVQVSVFMSLKSHFVQAIFLQTIGRVSGAALQTLNPRNGPGDNADEFGAKLWSAVFAQTLLRLFGGKPGWISLRFLRRFEPGDLAQVGNDTGWFLDPRESLPAFGDVCRFTFASKVTGESDCLHAAMNASFFKSLQGRGLGVSKTGFSTAFGKNPASAASLNQQKFNATLANAIADRGDLLPSLRKP
jgi:hypothetical protein